MKWMRQSIKVLMVPVLLGLLLGAAGCYCAWPFGWERHHHDGGGYRDGGGGGGGGHHDGGGGGGGGHH